jgi:NitT/TauT family transport system permease protein
MATPKSIFLPVFILAFGIGFAQKVVFGATLAFFVITINAQGAVRSMPSGFVKLARSMGASKGQIYGQIYIPAMAPYIISGLRIGLIFVVTGVLSAEIYSASAGFGRAIANWGEYFEMPKLFAAVLLIVIFSVAANTILSVLERSGAPPRARLRAVA